MMFTFDTDTGVMHVFDDITGTLSICHQGFGSNTLIRYPEPQTPTCVFCIACFRAGVPHWRFLDKKTVLRQTVEEHLDG